jgi:hypothetical protein
MFERHFSRNKRCVNLKKTFYYHEAVWESH